MHDSEPGHRTGLDPLAGGKVKWTGYWLTVMFSVAINSCPGATSGLLQLEPQMQALASGNARSWVSEPPGCVSPGTRASSGSGYRGAVMSQEQTWDAFSRRY